MNHILLNKLKYCLLLFLSIISASKIHAQVKERNLLMSKYSLDFISKNIVSHNQWKPYPNTPDQWRNTLTETQISEILGQANKALETPIPEITASMAMDFVRSGDREKHGAASYGRRNLLMPLIVAESIEDKNKYTEKIFNLVWAICEESFWGVPAHISGTGLPDIENHIVDLFSAETGALLGLTDYLVGLKLDHINKLIRRRMYVETNNRLFQPMKKYEKYKWTSRTSPVNNWNPWIMSNLIMADLFLEKNETLRTQNFRDYLFHTDGYLNGLGDDGGCDEGPSYWFAAGASVYDVLEIAHSVTNSKIDIYSDPLIKNMASYVYKMHISDRYFVNFADADPKISSPDGLMMYRFGQAIKDPVLAKFGQWADSKFRKSIAVPGRHIMRVMENLKTLNKIEPFKNDYTGIKSTFIADIQVLTARSASDLYLAAHGGHNAESHNHNDVGDFLIYAKGEPVIIDAGRGNYTARTFSNKRYELWFTRSDHHNLPIINGATQNPGKKHEAKDVKSIGTELSMNLAAAYDSTALINTWLRKIKLSEAENQVEITDAYDLKTATSLQQIFMTTCTVNSDTPGLIVLTTPTDKKYNLTYDKKIWKVSLDLPSTEGMEYKSFVTKWDGQAVKRIMLSHTALKVKGNHKFTVKPQ